MIDVFAAYDNSDERLGGFFIACKENLVEFIVGENEQHLDYAVHEINSANCTPQYIQITYEQHLELPFILAAYMHGNEEAMVANGSNFIHVNDDHSFYSDSFIYTNSCSSGKLLGPELVNQGCRVFIGFKKANIVIIKHEEVSLKCQNSGLLVFLSGNHTAHEAFEEMRNYYSSQASKLFAVGDVLASSLLINTRENLIFDGDKDAVLENFAR